MAPNDVVVPANAGIHNHRPQLFGGVVVVCLFFNNSRGVWVPAFAGTTKAYGVPIPISFSAASIRSGGCILIASG